MSHGKQPTWTGLLKTFEQNFDYLGVECMRSKTKYPESIPCAPTHQLIRRTLANPTYDRLVLGVVELVECICQGNDGNEQTSSEPE